MVTADDEKTTDITVEGDKEEIERFWKVRRHVARGGRERMSVAVCSCVLGCGTGVGAHRVSNTAVSVVAQQYAR